MSVDSVTSSILEAITSQYTTTETTEEDQDSMGKEDFLTIFLAQLQYQDPLNPMEGTDMTSQLAQFSALEQQTNTNDFLEEISGKLDVQSQNALVDYVGKDVMIWSDTVTIEEGTVSDSPFFIEADAEVEVVIYDSSGVEVNRLSLGQLEAGTHYVDWDGRDDTGEMIEEGRYTYEVIATDEDGEEVSVQTAFRGTVTGITYEYDEPYLMIGDGLVSLDSVIRVLSPSEKSDDTVS